MASPGVLRTMAWLWQVPLPMLRSVDAAWEAGKPLFGVPLFSSPCWTETTTDAEEKILAIQRSHWEEIAHAEDIGIYREFDLIIIGRVRSLTRDERSKVNQGAWMNQPNFGIYADIERVPSVRKTLWWHSWCERIVSVLLVIAVMAHFDYLFGWITDSIINLIYG
ncbi:MAG: hypothetical protein H8F28_11505 [Fibrella sp.]|nr:hypothetical protein [Armatimonadota bacterium]